uniref:Uncharacterized protein n=1 Tax=Oryza brachyantha TaxID=4533 RepID=J3L8S8_ORYBR
MVWKRRSNGENSDLDVLRVDLEMLGEEEAEPGGVEVGAGADDAAGREPRQLPRHVRQHVHRVRHDQQQRLRRVLRQRRHDLPEQRHVPLQQVQPRLAGDLPRAGRHDGQVRPPRHGHVGVGDEAHARQERRRVLQVKHLPAQLVRQRVHQRDLVRHVTRQDGLRDRHPDVAGADDRDLRQAPPVRRRRRRPAVRHRPEEPRRRAVRVEPELRQRRRLLHPWLSCLAACRCGSLLSKDCGFWMDSCFFPLHLINQWETAYSYSQRFRFRDDSF